MEKNKKLILGILGVLIIVIGSVFYLKKYFP